MALTENQIKDVCNVYGGSDRCKYMDEELVEDKNGDLNIIYICRKLSPEKKSIDKRLSNQLTDCAINGTNPKDEGIPMGDNCNGYVALHHIPQGYDV